MKHEHHIHLHIPPELATLIPLLLTPCASFTQEDIDRLTLTLTRSSDRLAKALKKATKDHGSTHTQS